jgi:hypothetical protein
MTASVRPGEVAEGLRWPHIALALGGSSSVAANVAHAYVAGSPPAGSVIASVLWPVLVFVAVELLICTPWPAGWAWAMTRFVGVGLVGAVAAVVSYRHMSGLLATYGEDRVVSGLGPVAVDGLMVMATASLVAVRRVQARQEVAAPPVTSVRQAAAARDASAQAACDTLSTATTQTAPRTRKDVRPTGSAADLLARRVHAARELIASGELDECPSAEAIRKRLGGSAAIARAVRDALTTTPEPAAGAAPTETNHSDSRLRLAR